jgi:hypothetical protein
MGDLRNKFIDESYGSLLHTTEDTGLSGNTKSVVQDGNGVDSALKISTDKVDVDGDLQTGGTDRITSTGELVNVSGSNSQFTNDEGYISSIPNDVLRSGDNVSELVNDSGYITSIPADVMRQGNNNSLLTNDSGYISSIPSDVMREGEDVSLLNNDAGYLTDLPSDVMREGENVSLLNNDAGYLTDVPTDVLRSGDNISELVNDSGYITEAKTIKVEVVNASGGSIQKGKVVYLTGQSGGLPSVALADNSSPSTMPAIGFVEQTIGNGSTGNVILMGDLTDFNTNSFSPGAELYVDTVGNLTETKPTGTALIQKVAKCVVSAGSGEILIIGAGRTNDLPNLPENHIWKGDADGVPQAVETPSGALQTENGQDIGINRTKITDSNGNDTGFFIWKDYGLSGVENSYDTSQNPQFIISNDNFNVFNSPLGPFGSGSMTQLSFGDVDDYATYYIQQNRFGSVTYHIPVDSQRHIFSNQDSSARIDMNYYGSPNNSDSWYEAYISNLSDVIWNGSSLEFVNRGGNTFLTVPIPTGTPSPSLYSSVKAISNVGSRKFFKLNVPTSSYSAAAYTMGVDTLSLNPIYDVQPGETINEVAIRVTTGQAGATLSIGLYTLTEGDAGIYPATLVRNLGNVDASTSGLKEITNVNYTTPSTEFNGLYFGILQLGGSGSVSLLGPTNTASVSLYSELDGTIHNRAMSVKKSGVSELPATISELEWGGYLHNTQFVFLGTR